jgi:hypothetical protein
MLRRRQLPVMNENRRCSILFHLLVTTTAWHQAWHLPSLTSNDELMPGCIAGESRDGEVGASCRLLWIGRKSRPFVISAMQFDETTPARRCLLQSWYGVRAAYPNAAAQTRIVSGGAFWPSQGELSRHLKYIARPRIPEFESHHPSQPVGVQPGHIGDRSYLRHG